MLECVHAHCESSARGVVVVVVVVVVVGGAGVERRHTAP